jgi:hypothetical protein
MTKGGRPLRWLLVSARARLAAPQAPAAGVAAAALEQRARVSATTDVTQPGREDRDPAVTGEERYPLARRRDSAPARAWPAGDAAPEPGRTMRA